MFNEWHIHLCDCTWSNVFSHAQSLLIKHKKDFWVFLVVFGKSFVFAKMPKISKTCFALFWRLSRRLIQSHATIASPHRNFSRLTSGSMSQSQKILRIFFKIWVFNVSRGSVWRLIRGWRFQLRGYLEIFVAYLATLSQVELLVAENT